MWWGSDMFHYSPWQNTFFPPLTDEKCILQMEGEAGAYSKAVTEEAPSLPEWVVRTGRIPFGLLCHIKRYEKLVSCDSCIIPAGDDCAPGPSGDGCTPWWWLYPKPRWWWLYPEPRWWWLYPGPRWWRLFPGLRWWWRTLGLGGDGCSLGLRLGLLSMERGWEQAVRDKG